MATFDYTLFESNRYDLLFRMVYDDELWSNVGQRGDPVTKAQTARVYFYIKNKDTDTTPVLMLTDADAAEIAWVDEADGRIAVKLNNNTEGIVGDKWYEVRVRFSDDTFVTAKRGRIKFVQSIVDTPDV